MVWRTPSLKRLSAMPTMTRQELTATLNAACREYPTNRAMQDELQYSFDILEPFHCDVFNPGFSDLPPANKAIVRSQMTQARGRRFLLSAFPIPAFSHLWPRQITNDRAR